MSKKFQKNKKSPWLAKNQGKFLYCRSCAKQRPAALFWDDKKRTPLKTCRYCMNNRRIAAKVRQGRTPDYQAYIVSKAWAKKRAEYWRSGEFDCCYLCLIPRFPGMQLHHRTYTRLGFEDLNDLVPVCPEHHELITARWRQEKSLKRMTLWEVTDLVRDEFQAALRQQD